MFKDYFLNNLQGINYIFYFRLLEEVSELEDSMRQLELKNENSEASLRDMQVIFIFPRNP